MPDTPYLEQPLRQLKGVGPQREQAMRRAGLRTIGDLLFRFPFRYEDRSAFRPIDSVTEGEKVTVSGELINCRVRFTGRRGFKIFEAVLRDPSGCLLAVWPNQAYRQNTLQSHQHVVLHGTVARYRGVLQLNSPDVEIVDEDAGDGLHTGRIVPVYEKIGTLTGRMQRALVREALADAVDVGPELLPEDVRVRLGLPGRREALAATHFPLPGTPVDELDRFRTPAQMRLILEEFFLFQVGVRLRRRELDAEPKPFVPVVDDHVRAAARAVLPFRLTTGQRDALKEIVEDMQRAQPMNRLLQGDVGSGKTIVALLAAMVALENGLQVALMVPTEILAEQHYQSITRLLAGTRFSVGLLTGSTPPAARRQLLDFLASGRANVVIGTHALIEEEVRFARLGLVVIDEQHRFGVVQRARLREKGLRPDILVMTATPIPRTLQLTLYGGLDVSVIRGLPPGRTPIKTTVRPEGRRWEIYEFIAKELEAGRQAYVIYPLVESSEKVDLRAATEMADHLAQDIFPTFRVGLLHGRMAQDAKDHVMRAFVAGDVQVLVATTVIEVGIDVPNATVMLVEHAERFGLSQLHQLRGRVGRGAHQAYCALVYQPPITEDAEARLRALAGTADGFEIAEQDLALRGSGDVAGTRQAGMPSLRVGNLDRDRDLMDLAATEATSWLAQHASDGGPVHEYVKERWARDFGLIDVG